MKKVGCLLFLLFFTNIVLAQKNNIDSLKQVVATASDSLKASIYGELAWDCRTTRPTEAIRYGELAIAYAKEFKDYLQLTKSYNITGVCYRNNGSLTEAFDYYFLALESAELHNYSEQLGYSLINIGNFYLYQNKLDSTVKYINNAIEIARSIKHKKMEAYCYINLSRALLKVNDYNKALIYSRKALPIRIETKDIHGEAVVNKQIGNIFFKSNELDSSKRYFEKAISLSKQFPSYELEAHIYNKLASLCVLKNNYNMAKIYSDTALSKALLTKNPTRIKGIYETLTRVYEKNNNFKQAIVYNKLANLYSDSAFLLQINTRVSKVKLETGFSKRQNIIDTLTQTRKYNEQSIERKNISLVFLWLFMGLLVLGLVLLSKSMKKKKETNKILADKNIKIQLQTEELNATLDNLQNTQTELIQAEKMASLGQLIAGIAHEINTPIGAIKASASNVIASSEASVKLTKELFGLLPQEMSLLFYTFVEACNKSNEVYSSRELRKVKKELRSKLEEHEVENARKMADKLAEMKVFSKIEQFIPLFTHKESDLLVKTAFTYSEMIKNSKNISAAVERVAKIIFALKNFSRQDNTGIKVKTDLAQSLETVLTLYHNQMKQGIKIVKKYEKVPEIECFADELNQVWTNIIHNAIQAMDGQGTLEINLSAKAENSTVVVSIKDEGGGIPENIRDKILTPFFTTKAAGEGTGLGLDIVNKIVDKHGGNLSFESKEGIGTTFFIELPI